MLSTVVVMVAALTAFANRELSRNTVAVMDKVRSLDFDLISPPGRITPNVRDGKIVKQFILCAGGWPVNLF
jgi:hypothetical protein